MTIRLHSVLVLGGSGFIGRHLIARLAAAGHAVTVVTRRRAAARHLILLPTVDVVEGDPYDEAYLARVARGMTAAINLVGILNESGRTTFARAHVDLPRTLIAACRKAGVPRLLHMSALNAQPGSASRYLQTKAEGEALVAGSGLAWTIFRPSVVFGREDHFLNLFAQLMRALPVIALAGATSRFQPIYVGDVARCFAAALVDDATVGQRFELCGPNQYTLRELVSYVGQVTGKKRPIVELGGGLAKLQATLLEHLPGKLMTRDNLASMAHDSICRGTFPSVFGAEPTPLEAVVPGYLAPESARSRFDLFREHGGR